MSEVTPATTAAEVLNGAAPVAEAPPEPPKEPAKEAPKEPEFMSDKFAALARKEKTLVKKSQELSSLKADIEKQQSALKSQQEEYQRWLKIKENAKLDPDSYLSEAGLTYGYLTERALKGDKGDPKAILEHTEKRLSEFEKRQEEAKKQAEEAAALKAKEEWEAQLQGFAQSISDFVDENADTYELIKIHDQKALIFDVIQEGARRQKVISVKEAAEKVENYLAQQVEKALESKKFKEKFSPVKKEVAPPAKDSGTPTLSNNMSTSTPHTSPAITDKERMERALAALNKSLGE